MLTASKTPRTVWIAPLISLLICGTANCETAGSKKPSNAEDFIATLPVVGFRRVPVDEVIKQAKEPSGGWIFDETAAAGAALSADPRYSKELDAYLVAMASQEPEASKIWLHSNSSVLPEAIVAWEEPYVKKANSILVSGNPKNGIEVSFDGIFKGKDLQVEHDTPFVAMRWKDNQRLDRDGIGFILGTNKTIKHREFNHGKTEDVYLDLNLDTKFATNLRTTYSPLSLNSVNRQPMSKK